MTICRYYQDFTESLFVCISSKLNTIRRIFHAIYGERMAAISILDGQIPEGELPKKALEMVLEWNAIHKDALLNIWETQEFVALSPLE